MDGPHRGIGGGQAPFPPSSLPRSMRMKLQCCVCTEAMEMRHWRGSVPVSAAGGGARHGGCSAAVQWMGPGLTTVVKDARLHDALQAMYIPPSLLRIGSTIGRGTYIRWSNCEVKSGETPPSPFPASIPRGVAGQEGPGVRTPKP